MLLETTHLNKKQNELINDLVGKPFGLFQAIKLQGIGSKRMAIETVSPNMKHDIHTHEGTTFTTIELRPIGILIKINEGNRNFTWIIPYYQLVIYKANSISIHCQGRFIQFKNDLNFKENKAFFQKLLDQKVKYDSLYEFQV